MLQLDLEEHRLKGIPVYKENLAKENPEALYHQIQDEYRVILIYSENIVNTPFKEYLDAITEKRGEADKRRVEFFQQYFSLIGKCGETSHRFICDCL